MKYLYFVTKTFFLLIFIVGCIGFWSIYSESGRSFLVHVINSFPLPSEVQIKVERIHSIFPLHTHISNITLSEDQRKWIEIEDVEVKADIFEYLQNNKIIAVVNAEKLTVNKVIEGTPSASTIDESSPNVALDFDIEVELSINTLQVLGYVDDIPIEIKDLKINANSSNNLNVQLRGWVANFGDPLKFTGQAVGSLDDFQAGFKVESNHLKYDGFFANNILFTGKVDGLPAQPKGRFTFQGDPLALGVLNSEFAVSQDNQLIQIDLKKLESKFLNAKGMVKLTPSTNDVDVKFDGVLEKHALPEMYSVEGGSFNVDLQSKGDKISTNAKVEVESFDGFGYQAKTFSLHSAFSDLSLSGSGSLTLSAKDLQAYGFQFDTLSLKSNLSNGTASLDLDAQGPEARASLSAKLKGDDDKQTLTIEKSEFEYSKILMKLAEPSRITRQGSTITLAKTQLDIAENVMTLSGKTDTSTVDFTFKGDLNLENFAILFLPPEHFLEGTLSADFKIKGALKSPNIRGTLNLRNGLYENLEYGAYINDIQADIDANGQSVTISEFRAQSHKEGSIRGAGTIDLAKNNMSVDVSGSSFKLLDSELIRADIREFALKLSGEFDNLMCSGNVLFEKGKLDIGTNLAPEIKLIKDCDDQKIATDAQQKQDLPSFVTLDIKVGSQPLFEVKGRGLDSVWGGELTVKGNALKPILAGEIKLERGSFKLLGTDLDLTEGNILFSGDKDNKPYIQIVATTQNAEYKMQVSIRGTPESLNFDFSSNPSLPKDEIISQILFGKLSEDLTAFEAIQLARSIAALTGGGSSTDIMGELSESLGVDLISVGFDKDQSTASIHIEKRLNDRVKIVTDQSSDIEESSVGVEMKITDHISLKSQHGLVTPDENISINYKLDY